MTTIADQIGVSVGVLIALGVLIVVQLTLQVTALVNLVRLPSERVRTGKKYVWLLIIVIGEIVGPIIYFAAGRLPAPAEDTGRASGATADAADKAADVLYGASNTSESANSDLIS